MRKYVTFGNLRSDTDLGLSLASVSVGSPAVRTTYVDVPGADGSLDLTEALGDVYYGPRELVFSLGKVISNRYEQDSTVKNALHGRRMKIVLSDDPGRYYVGRLTVGEWVRDHGLGRVTISATCDPWRFKTAATVVTGTVPNSGTLTLVLPNERRPVVPTVEVSATATLTFGSLSASVGAGEHRLLSLRLVPGRNVLTVAAAAGTTVTVTYQEASL